jgi:hypothetical protein
MLLGVALAGAAALAAFGDKTPGGEVAQAVARPVHALPAGRPVARAAGQGAVPAILRLVPREVLIGDGADRFGEGGKDVFEHQDWTPPPAPPPPPAPAPPPPPPAAPPLPFTYIGKSLSDGAWAVYLARGAETYLVREQTVIDATWRVDAIAPPILTLTYLPLNQVQQLNIGGYD